MTQFRPSRFQVLPPVIKNLLIINILVFIAQSTINVQFDLQLEKWFALHSWQSPWFKPWQIITRLFLHSSFLHLFFNMLGLWMLGSVLENLWGAKRFLIFYFSCALGANLAYLTLMYFKLEPIATVFYKLPIDVQNQYINSPNFVLNSSLLGASAPVFGCLTAFGYLFPNSIFYLYFVVPIKAKWLVIFSLCFELVLAIIDADNDTTAHISHLGGAVVGFALVYFWNKTNKKRFY